MENMIDLNMSFTFSTGQLDGKALRNLVNMLYSRGPLLTAATGGRFGAARSPVHLLEQTAKSDNASDIVQALVAHDPNRTGTLLSTPPLKVAGIESSRAYIRETPQSQRLRGFRLFWIQPGSLPLGPRCSISSTTFPFPLRTCPRVLPPLPSPETPADRGTTSRWRLPELTSAAS